MNTASTSNKPSSDMSSRKEEGQQQGLLAVMKGWFVKRSQSHKVAHDHVMEKDLLLIDADDDSLEDEPDSASVEDEPPTWEALPGTACVAAWATEIRAAIGQEPESLPWQLIGPGAIIEVQDIELGGKILRRAAIEAGLGFMQVDVDDVLGVKLNVDNLIDTASPLLIYLEPGIWMFPVNEEKASEETVENIYSFRVQLKNFLTTLNSQHPVVVATVAKSFDDVAAPLRSINFFPRRLSIRAATAEETGLAFIKQLGEEHCAVSILTQTGKVGKLAADFEDARTRALHVFSLHRLATKEKRLVEFEDLMAFATKGTTECDDAADIDQSYLRMVAVHEAGHATMAIIDSAGSNTPEYLSIIPSLRYNGVSVDSIAYRFAEDEQRSYLQTRHRIRTSLAGRVAEELVYGPENVSSGAAEDLTKSTQLASHAFARLGFAPDMEGPGQSASNLAVVIGEPTASEYAHVENLVRTYLATEYGAVKDLLNAHRPLLDEVTEYLLAHKIMYQRELLTISVKHVGI